MVRGFYKGIKNVSKIFDMTVSSKHFYPGGFNSKMDKREAALIIGCRESSEQDKILSRYKKLMILNHPDRGGSPYLALKVNEAKEILAKGS